MVADRAFALDRHFFEPTDSACEARIAAIEPDAYVRTRNHLHGQVTRLSPYLTHGFVSIPDVVTRLRQRHPLPMQHKLVYEFGWREYFQHLWSRLGDQIFTDLRPPPGRDYRSTVPDDLRQGATGIPVIDQSVRTLYATGYLHNHARMWLASYAVHLRKVHWRAGADWMYGHLLDGDLASNHLSWQWVAGTLTGKPYVFDSANVARYAPEWASPHSAIDRSYDELLALAQGGTDLGPDSDNAAKVAEPALLAAPPEHLGDASAELNDETLHLVHPWSLARTSERRVGIIELDFHARHPWSARRWTFVGERMAALCDQLLVGTQQELGLRLRGRELKARATHNPGYRELFAIASVQTSEEPRLLDNPGRACASFSQFWKRTTSVDTATSTNRD